MKNENKPNNNLSALVLKGYELVFFRRHLGMEKVTPEIGAKRNKYLDDVLIPALNEVDNRVRQVREQMAERLPNGGFKTNPDGEIQYGDKEKEARQKFEDIISGDVILPVNDKEQFSLCRGIFANLKQELNEDDTNIYLKVAEKLNAVEI